MNDLFKRVYAHRLSWGFCLIGVGFGVAGVLLDKLFLAVLALLAVAASIISESWENKQDRD